ncbi:MAG: aminotransferase class III-fold pyridoxal phosphate-dependent enzyme, partial [Kiloniellales bacterium]
VITGFGRLGRWFGSDHFNLEPDLMTLAKGLTSGYLPLSAVMVGERVARTLQEKGSEFHHGFTYSGHPVACAVGLANLKLIETEGLIARVHDETGPYLQKRIRELADHPLVGEVRGIGFIGAIELVKDKKTRTHFEPLGKVGLQCRDHCFKNGLVMRSVRDAMVISPPLIFEKTHIDELVEKAHLCFDLTAKDLGAM